MKNESLAFIKSIFKNPLNHFHFKEFHDQANPKTLLKLIHASKLYFL
jgi:hypothetical protein